MPLQQLVSYFNARFEKLHHSNLHPFRVDENSVTGIFGPISISSAYLAIRQRLDNAVVTGHIAQLLAAPVANEVVNAQAMELGALVTDTVTEPVNFQAIINIDRLCRTVHMLNYLPLSHLGGVLFLDVDPRHILSVKQDHGVYCGFIRKRFDNCLSYTYTEPALFAEFIAESETIAAFYEQREFSKAMREIMALADKANQYIDEKKPWVIAKEEGNDAELHNVCSVAINLFRVLVTYLKPVLPVLTHEAGAFLNTPIERWADQLQPLVSHTLNDFQPLMTRVEADKIAAIVEASKETLLKT